MFKKCRICVFVLALAVLIAGSGLETAHAEAPYKTYTVDGYGWMNQTQSAYMPYETILKFEDGESGLALKTPCDLKITDDGWFFVADTGNKRIVVADENYNVKLIIKDKEFKHPCGLFVTEDKTIYVADRDAKAIFVYDINGNLLNKYVKPNHPLYGDAMDFKPTKLVVNAGGDMYIVAEGNTNGIIQLSPTDGGTFVGYFGTNDVTVSLVQIIQQLIFTEKQKEKLLDILPPTPTNLAIDDKGLIYTITMGEELNTLKKLNIAGINMIEPDWYEEIPAAVVAGNYDNVYLASSQGYIYEYNSEGEVLFIFGGSDDGRQRIGLFTKVEAIAVDKYDRLYVLDSDKAQIQVFEPTEFTNLLHEALYLFSKGRYTESKAPLVTVLEMNSLFDYANMAMGRAYLQEENYEMALKYARLAKDGEGYNDALWEVRNIWIQDNLIPMAALIVLAIIVLKVLKKLQKEKGIFNGIKAWLKKLKENKLVGRLVYGLYYIKHPIDGCYGVRREGKSSLLAANIILAIIALESIINKYFCGFLFKNVREGRYDIFSDIGGIFVIFILIIACNYLMCTINDGEGSFKQIYSGMAYSLVPYILFTPVIFVLSHIVTINESFLVQLPTIIMYGWIIVLILTTVKEINNYTVKETAKIVIFTFFTLLIALLLVFILYVLWSQVIDFVVAIGGEVVYRLGL